MQQIYLGDKEQIYVCEYKYDEVAPSLVILPNIGWYHVGPNRMFSQIAARCIENKINCFCFDYIGSGESFGYYDNCSYQNMMMSFHKVYNYVVEKYNSNIFLLGYGAGNILLKEIESKSVIQGAIYYLPHFKDILKYKSKIISDKMAKKRGYYNIEVSDEENNFIFWRGLLGEIHDCTYNPINYNLVVELSEALVRLKDAASFAKHKLVISDEEMETQQFDVRIIKEFKENILPKDWYKTVNLWPDSLFKTYCWIIEWITKKSVEKNLKKDLYLKKTTKSFRMVKENVIRELVSFQSGKKILFGVLNLPRYNAKKLPCVIFIPGLGGDKVDNFMCGPRIGDKISENGCAFFRYDNRFSGSTANTLTDFTWTEVIEDFKNAFNTLKVYEDKIDFNNISLVSWSNGAKLLSYIASNNLCSVQTCCLWNPVFVDIDIKQKFSDKKNMGRNMTRYKKNFHRQLVTQIGGEYLGMSFNIDNKKYDFLKDFHNISYPIKVIWGTQDIVSPEYQYIEKMEKDISVESYLIDSEHHLFSYRLLEIVIRETVNYIKKYAVGYEKANIP